MSDSQLRFDIGQIVGTLKYGRFNGNKKSRIILAYIAITLVSWIIFIGIYAVVAIYIIGKGKNEGYLILVCMIVPDIIVALLILLYVKNEQQRKEIKLWLEDAVELTAYSRKIDTYVSHFMPNMFKVQIEFAYMGKPFCYVSRGKHFRVINAPDGCHIVWKDYLDKEVNILYSPKYQEVMVRKNKKEHNEGNGTT